MHTYIPNEQKQINKKGKVSCLVLFLCTSWYIFFFIFFFFFFFFKQIVTLGKKVNEPRRWHTELAVYFRGVVSFFGSSGIYSSSWWFSEVVGVITHVAEETKIGVGWVKVKKLPILRVGKWKSVLIDSFVEKKFHVVWYLRPFCIVLEVSSAGTFENFSRCFAGFFLSWWNDACS